MEETTVKENNKLKTGICSGSFSPVPSGPWARANWLCEFAGLDELWFVITPHNPLKDRSNLMDDRLRLELVEAAIAGYAKFRASDIEFTLPQPTYTIDTLRTLDRTYPDREFHFIMGADNWSSINRYEINIPDNLPDIRKVDAPLMEISSTFIRESLAAGKDIRFFLPEAIRNHKCFSNI